jgi:peptide-methionine (S)-S-oxide reductase
MNATKILAALIAAALAVGTVFVHANPARLVSVAPTTDVAPRPGERVAVFAGGCFWGIEAVFEHVKGVRHASSGYAGGTAATADYEMVSSGRTRHAEAVKVIYDPAQVSYGQLLKVFFQVAHDPTQLNRQGPDTGPQYRSAIFHADNAQKAAANAYIAELQRAKAYPRPVVTEVVPLTQFYPAEAYHQDYARRNPNSPYIVIHDAPKVRDLQASLPDLYVSR